MAIEQHGIAVSIEAQLDKFRKELKDSGSLVDVVTTGMDKATRRAATSFNRIQARIDPATRAFRRYEQQVSQVNFAVEKGIKTQAEAERVLHGLTAEYERSVAKIGALRRTVVANDDAVAKSSVNYRKFGAIAQQAGYQVGDFAVQVASGQNPLVAMTQQSAQLLGFFGPWGAVLGAAAAVAGALAVSLWDTGDSAGKAADGLKEYQREVKAADDFVKSLNDSVKDTSQLFADQESAVLGAARQRILQAQRDLDEAQKRLKQAKDDVFDT
ncbi:phage tail length tape measure family protein, partial [Thalassospira sp. MCCC 1A01428]|uniref:phage tail length tape measure family protein n=1 Tax=Thalassospira sp. MCCC 1A01428 TaxID=1470575 RepID=UPI000A25A0D5